MKTLVYKAKTKADWIRIVGKALKEGKVWRGVGNEEEGGNKEVCLEVWEVYRKDTVIYIGKDIQYGSLSSYNKIDKSSPDYIPMWKEKKPETLSKICRDIWEHRIGYRAGERRIRKII